MSLDGMSILDVPSRDWDGLGYGYSPSTFFVFIFDTALSLWTTKCLTYLHLRVASILLLAQQMHGKSDEKNN